MKTFIVPVRAATSVFSAAAAFPRTFEIVLRTATKKAATDKIEALLAHGHSIANIVDRDDWTDCDVTGDEARAAHRGRFYLVGAKMAECEAFDDVAEIAGEVTQCDLQVYLRARALAGKS